MVSFCSLWSLGGVGNFQFVEGDEGEELQPTLPVIVPIGLIGTGLCFPGLVV